MANAEKLLNEAHYAFNRINSGESPDNRRNASRARSLCMKIIRRYPASAEASSAKAILRRLGDATYEASLASPPESTQKKNADTESLNWQGLLTLLLKGPKWPLIAAGAATFFLFTIFGPLFLIFLVAIVFFIGPLKKQLTPERRRDLNEMIARANAHVKD